MLVRLLHVHVLVEVHGGKDGAVGLSMMPGPPLVLRGARHVQLVGGGKEDITAVDLVDTPTGNVGRGRGRAGGGGGEGQ